MLFGELSISATTFGSDGSLLLLVAVVTWSLLLDSAVGLFVASRSAVGTTLLRASLVAPVFLGLRPRLPRVCFEGDRERALRRIFVLVGLGEERRIGCFDSGSAGGGGLA